MNVFYEKTRYLTTGYLLYLSLQEVNLNNLELPDIYVEPTYKKGHPFWALDIHRNWQTNEYIERIEQASVVFYAQPRFKKFINKLNKNNLLVLNSTSQNIFTPIENEIIYDVGFIGEKGPHFGGERANFLNFLSQDFNVLDRNNVVDSQEYCRLLSSCRFVFNYSRMDDINTRMWEAMAIKRPLLTNIITDINYVGVPGTHFLTYGNYQSLKKIIEKTSDNEATTIAKNGYRHFLKKHTMKHRLLTMINFLKEYGN